MRPLRFTSDPLGIARIARGGRPPATAEEATAAARRLNAEAQQTRAARDAEHRTRPQGAPASTPAAKVPVIRATDVYRRRAVRAELTDGERTTLEEARRRIDEVLGDRPADEAAADGGQDAAEPSQDAAEPAARIDVAAIYAARRRQQSAPSSGAPAAPTPHRPRSLADVARAYYGGGQADGAGLIGASRRGGAR